MSGCSRTTTWIRGLIGFLSECHKLASTSTPNTRTKILNCFEFIVRMHEYRWPLGKSGERNSFDVTETAWRIVS